MNKPNDPSTVTVDEAVARMVNMEYIPEGFTLTDMTSAFLEEAEVEYENARIEHLPEDQLAILKNRFETCAARHSLTLLLQKELLREFENPTDFNVIISGDSSIEPRVALSSVSNWAADRYGISVSEVPNILNPSNGGNDSAIYRDFRDLLFPHHSSSRQTPEDA